MKRTWRASIALGAAALITMEGACRTESEDRPPPDDPAPRFGLVDVDVLPVEPLPAGLKVAVIGDTGMGQGYRAVLKMIREEGADLVLHQGDLGYSESDPASPVRWEAVLSEVLGPDFPYFFSIGNHDRVRWQDKDSWPGYASLLQARLDRVPGVRCGGPKDGLEHGIYSFCTYKGLLFVLSGAASVDNKPDHADFVDSALAAHPGHRWKLCTWHKNHPEMQVGSKRDWDDDLGWRPYQACQKHGAVVLTGHSHTYSRTRTLTAMGNTAKSHGAMGPNDQLTVGPGRTFVVVSGLGGRSIRAYNCRRHDDRGWWASLFTVNHVSRNGTALEPKDCQVTRPIEDEFGALFLTFGAGGKADRAIGRFVTTKRRVTDVFEVSRVL